MMKKILLTFLLFSSSVSSEVIDVLCKTVEGSYKSGVDWATPYTPYKYKNHAVFSLFGLESRSVEVKINTTEKFMIFNQINNMKVSMSIKGNEFVFDSIVINGKAQTSQNNYDRGTLNRETGILSVTNYIKQDGVDGLEFGFSQEFECKKTDYKF